MGTPQMPVVAMKINTNDIWSLITRQDWGSKFCCPLCKKAFKVFDQYARHISRFHPPDGLICPLCQGRFSSDKELNQHYDQAHSGQKLSRLFNSNENGNVRVACNLQIQELYKCKKCDNPPKPYKCDQCQTGFANKYNLKRHQPLCTGQPNVRQRGHNKPHKCEICGKNFVQRNRMLKHYADHTRFPEPQPQPLQSNGCEIAEAVNDATKQINSLEKTTQPKRLPKYRRGPNSKGKAKSGAGDKAEPSRSKHGQSGNVKTKTKDIGAQSADTTRQSLHDFVNDAHIETEVKILQEKLGLIEGISFLTDEIEDDMEFINDDTPLAVINEKYKLRIDAEEEDRVTTAAITIVGELRLQESDLVKDECIDLTSDVD